MLTSRAWWLLALDLMLLLAGVVGAQPALALVGLGLLVWLIGEGLLFSFRVRWVVRDLTLSREVRDERGAVASLWAGRTFQVRLTLRLRGRWGLPHVTFEEPVPFGLEAAGGSPRGEGWIGPEDDLLTVYSVKASRPGRVRFEGVKVQLADLGGLFYYAAFVRLPLVLRVLPALVDAEGKTATTKRHNLLPPPGINRLPRPGSGSELLDLRDYLPGDPPKTIAWKVSARRDRLITKEYESEVPVRCTLFMDTSNAVRLGPPGKNALARLVEIASAVAQANMAARDLTGLVLFDEAGVAVTKPARTRRHLVQLYTQLGEAAGLTPAAGVVDVEALLPLAYSFAQEVYPEQLAQGVNAVPRWLPFFVPVPGPWVTRRTPGTRLYRWVAYALATALFALVGLGLLDLVDTVYTFEIPRDFQEQLSAAMSELFGRHIRLDLEKDREALLPDYDRAFLAWAVLMGFFFPLWIGLVRDFIPLVFAPARRRKARQRKKLAALFARRYDLGPGGVELLLNDDEHFGTYLERFLNEHHVPHTPVLYDRRGRFLYASPAKVDVLAAALLRAVGKGHDNELFVLLVDLVELEGRLAPLVRAVKVALARHHQVVLICPWPPDLDRPGETPPDSGLSFPGLGPGHDAGEAGPGKRRPRPVERQPRVRPGMSPQALREFLKRLTGQRYHRAFHRLRRTFARLQVPVVCAAADESVHLVLERLDRLRGLRRRR